MPVAPVTQTPPPTSIHTGTTTDPSARKQTLDGEVFLRLLVTQLTNQDPSSPMDTNAMISQTTELAMMEQITALTNTSSEAFALNMRQAATAIIGHEVSYKGTDGATITGVATKVSFDGPIPLVTVGGKSVPLDALTAITSTTSTADAPTA